MYNITIEFMFAGINMFCIGPESGSVYTIPDSLCADTKTISDRASVHTGITNFGAVFTTERRCAASILKVNRHVSDRFGPFLFTLCRSVFHVGTKSYPV